jgi:hypothetical protein
MAQGSWTLWADLPEPARTALRAIYRDLRQEYRLGTVPVVSQRLVRRLAKSAAEVWAVADVFSEEAAALALKRHGAKGRRPNLKAVRTAAKRQGMQLGSLADALARLALVTKPRHHRVNGRPADDLAEAILAVPPVSDGPPA